MEKEIEQKEVKPRTEKFIDSSGDIHILEPPSRIEIFYTYNFFKEDHRRDVCRIFKQKVEPTKKEEPARTLLDVGCRDNSLQTFFDNIGFAWYGIDPYPTNGAPIIATMEKIPWKDESFSAIFCCHAFEHSENPIQALREMKRVCRLGGFLFIATPIHSDYQNFNCDKTHVIVPTASQMRRMFNYVGLEPVCIEHWKLRDSENRLGTLISIAKVVN